MQRHVWDEDEEYGDVEEVLQSSSKPYMMSADPRDIAHWYVLSNFSIMQDLYT